MFIRAVEGVRCTADEEEATELLVVELRAWLDRERSLSPASAVRMRSVSPNAVRAPGCRPD